MCVKALSYLPLWSMIKQYRTTSLLHHSFSTTMAIEEPKLNSTSDHVLDWLEDSVSFVYFNAFIIVELLLSQIPSPHLR